MLAQICLRIQHYAMTEACALFTPSLIAIYKRALALLLPPPLSPSFQTVAHQDASRQEFIPTFYDSSVRFIVLLSARKLIRIPKASAAGFCITT